MVVRRRGNAPFLYLRELGGMLQSDDDFTMDRSRFR